MNTAMNCRYAFRAKTECQVLYWTYSAHCE